MAFYLPLAVFHYHSSHLHHHKDLYLHFDLLHVRFHYIIVSAY